MAVQIVKMEKESCPASRFIGKRYTDADRVNGNFGAKWGEWFANNWFAPLESMGGLPINDGTIGAMHIVDGDVEYWIGMFFPPETEVPEGYEYVDIEALNYAVCYLYGNENNGELYGLDTHNMCLDAIAEKGWKRKEDDWCFERYNCPRFTTPDEKGNVILDYGISIEK